MKIYSWNINGIRAVHRKKAFEEFFEKQNPDILCVQETKAQENDLSFDIKMIDGYESYFKDAEKKGYSGTAVYTKIKAKKVIDKTGVEILDKEGRTQVLDFDKFVLINCYFPNGKASRERLDYKMKFYKEFLKYILKLRKDGKKVIFCGDVNTAHKEIDLTHPKPNEKTSGFLPSERAWLDKLIENNYFDTFRKFDQSEEKYSWWSMRSGARSRNVGWRIDYFFANKSLEKNITNAQIHSEALGSDHCPISINLSF